MVFEFEDYKAYLKTRLSTTGEQRGIRSKLAAFLGCQTSFISQVLGGYGDFTVEHGIRISEFLNHSEDERHFFMLLVQKNRSGNQELKRYYQEQMDAISERRSQIKERIKVNEGLSEKDHQVYYGQWYYSAVHILVAIEDYQTFESIQEKLKLSPKVLSETLEFLQEKGLVERVGDRYVIGQARIHLDRRSPMIVKHHTNWRLEAIKSLESQNPSNFHYSSILAISKDDALKIKDILLSSLESIEPVVAPSREEELYSLCMDLFSL